MGLETSNKVLRYDLLDNFFCVYLSVECTRYNLDES